MTDKRRTNNKQAHAIALFSGGLDSSLAILLLLKQNIRVTAITFMTHFGCDLNDPSGCGQDPYPMAKKFGFEARLVHLGQKFVDIVRAPKFGYGKNMNPCTDCRILMLNEAKEFMESSGADFIVTGEVMGQRPMSQLKDKLNLVLNQTELKGKVLRPLSAKLLLPTEAELSGLVDREQLEGISGRGRKRQIELAEQLGLDDYPAPASGCLLTDPGYSKRLRELMDHEGLSRMEDLSLLRVGRHFRLDENTRAIVGRNEADNHRIMALIIPDYVTLEAVEIGSPLTIVVGDQSEDNLRRAAQLTARYSAGKKEPTVEVAIKQNGVERSIVVEPAGADAIGAVAIY